MACSSYKAGVKTRVTSLLAITLMAGMKKDGIPVLYQDFRNSFDSRIFFWSGNEGETQREALEKASRMIEWLFRYLGVSHEVWVTDSEGNARPAHIELIRALREIHTLELKLAEATKPRTTFPSEEAEHHS